MDNVVSLNAFRNSDREFKIGRAYMSVVLEDVREKKGLTVINEKTFINKCFDEVTDADNYELPISTFFLLCREHGLSVQSSSILFNGLADTVFRFYEMKDQEKMYLSPSENNSSDEEEFDWTEAVITFTAAMVLGIALIFLIANTGF